MKALSALHNEPKWLVPRRPLKSGGSSRVRECGGAERAPTPIPAASLPTVAAPSLLPPDRPDNTLPAPGAPSTNQFTTDRRAERT